MEAVALCTSVAGIFGYGFSVPVSFTSLVSSVPGEYDIDAPVSDMGHNPL